MKIQGTSADAMDLLEAIKVCLAVAATGQMPTFHNDFQARLIREVLAELREGRIESYGFERLIATLQHLWVMELFSGKQILRMGGCQPKR